MQEAPFHRKILPWIFLVAFLGTAPAVLFYTSGFRWNSKKGLVERNGTLILDSTPSGAMLAIDGIDTGKTTPVTIQNMAPGLHLFQMTKNGYSSWQKHLEVVPERVTFANTVHLWNIEAPKLVSPPNPADILEMSPNGQYLLTLRNGTTTRVVMRDVLTDASHELSLPVSTDAIQRASWSSNARYLLLEPRTTNASSAWILDMQGAVHELPPAAYHWADSQLLGSSKNQHFLVRLPTFSLETTRKPSTTLDQTDTAEVRMTTGTNPNIIYVERSNEKKGIILPMRQWQLWQEGGSFVIFRDHDHWLSLRRGGDGPEIHEAVGDRLRPLEGSRAAQFLLVTGNELWRWDPLTDPELLYRGSEAIVNASWHPDGEDVFFATSQGVFVLNLDSRDGRMITSLGSFHTVTDFAVTPETIYIAGTKEATSAVEGVWMKAMK